jgi:hypothetical protein
MDKERFDNWVLETNQHFAEIKVMIKTPSKMLSDVVQHVESLWKKIDHDHREFRVQLDKMLKLIEVVRDERSDPT